MSPARNDPYPSYNFQVEIPGVTSAGFAEVSGLETDTNVIEYREGSDAVNTVRKLPGLTKVGDVTLKRGVTDDTSLWDWMKQVTEGNLTRQNVTIILLDESRNPVIRWNLHNAWPRKWSGPLLNAKSNEVAIENLVLCCERLERA